MVIRKEKARILENSYFSLSLYLGHPVYLRKVFSFFYLGTVILLYSEQPSAEDGVV